MHDDCPVCAAQRRDHRPMVIEAESEYKAGRISLNEFRRARGLPPIGAGPEFITASPAGEVGSDVCS